MVTERPGYLAYLLRLWQVNDNGKPVWLVRAYLSLGGARAGFVGVSGPTQPALSFTP
jgi:hypothetical protein